jgi:hypothetical protein
MGAIGSSYVIQRIIFPSSSYTKNCMFEPVLGGSQGQEVTKAFDRVIAG